MPLNINIRNSVIGLDIGVDSVRIAELKGGFRGFELLNFYESPIPKPNNDTNGADLSATLKSVFTEKQLYGKRVITSIPDRCVTFRFLTLPFQDSKKISSVIKYEVERLIPLSSDDIVVDYITLNTLNGKTDLLAVIADKNALKKRMDILSAANIDPEILDINLLAVTNTAKYKLDNLVGNSMVIEVGSSETSLSIINEGKIKFVKSISFGSSRLRKALTNPEYEEGLTGSEQTSQDTFQDSDDSYWTWNFEELFLEIERIKLWFDLEYDEFINRILLSGKDIAPDMESSFKDRLEIETVVWDPLKALNLNKNVRDGDYITAASLGLGLRGIKGDISEFNLRKEEFGRKHIFEGLEGVLRNLAIMFCVIVSLFTFDIYYKKLALEKRYQFLKQEGHRLYRETVPGAGKIVNEVHQLKEKANELRKNYDLIGGYAIEGQSVLDLLRDITNRFPKDEHSEIHYYSFSRDEIKFEGKAGSFETVDRIKSKLEEVKGIKEIKMSETRQAADQVSINFKMTLILSGSG